MIRLIKDPFAYGFFFLNKTTFDYRFNLLYKKKKNKKKVLIICDNSFFRLMKSISVKREDFKSILQYHGSWNAV